MRRAELAALRRLAKGLGVEPAFRAMDGTRVWASPDTLIAVLAAMGVDAHTPVAAAEAEKAIAGARSDAIVDPVLLRWEGEPATIDLRAEGRPVVVDATLTLENDEQVACRVDGGLLRLPRLPLGLHRLDVATRHRSGSSLIIAAPRTCYEPSSTALWGALAPTYALRRRGDGGAGDLRALSLFADRLADAGGTIVGTLPLLASDVAQEPSPYRPLSRLFWNEFYADVSPARWRTGGSSNDGGTLIDYPAVAAQRERRRRAASGGSMRATAERAMYARFRAARERFGREWRDWPDRIRRGRLRAGDVDPQVYEWHLHGERLISAQMHELASHVAKQGQFLYLDVPLGVHPNGYDTWRYRDEFIDDATVGAPPDDFFALGQDWAVPPPNPSAAREHGYRYWIATLRHQMRFAGMIRIDHVMGLHRLYVIPPGASARDGVFVRQHAEELYAILCLESRRHRCAVVGENLGTVPPEVNVALRRHGLSPMYVGQFNLPDTGGTAPQPSPESLASLNTHDMFPFLGFWRELDIRDLARRGLIGEAEACERYTRRERMKEALVSHLLTEGSLRAPTKDGRRAMQGWVRSLAASRARYVLISADDLYLETEPQNRPGTGPDQAPNWRRRFPACIEDGLGHPSTASIMRELNAVRRGAKHDG